MEKNEEKYEQVNTNSEGTKNLEFKSLVVESQKVAKDNTLVFFENQTQIG